MATYKLTYNNKIISMPSENEAVSYDSKPVTQYEKTLYVSPNGLGQTTGTISEPISNFDEIIVGLRYQSSPDLFNTEYYRYRSFTGENSICIRNEMTNTNTWFVVMNKLTIDNENLTWNVNKPSNNNWCIQNRYDQNVKWNVGGSTAISGVVSEIIGVKYQ